MTYGERIKMVRSLRDISQKELAELLGMKPQQLSQYENDDRTPKKTTLARIASALHVPLMLLETDADSEIEFLLAAENYGLDISNHVNTSILDISNHVYWPERQSSKDKALTNQIGKGLYLENLRRVANNLDVSGIETLTKIARTLEDTGRFNEK